MRLALADEVPAEEVERTLRELLEGTRFGSGDTEPEENVLVQALRSFFEWLGDLFSFGDVAEGAAFGSKVFLWIVALLAAGLLVGMLVAVARERLRREERPAVGAASVALRVRELREAARAARGAGDWTRALRLWFFATVVGLGERGDLEYRDAWTNRELLERGEPAPVARERLVPLVGVLDEASFGGRPTGAAEVERFASVCDDLLGGDA